MNILMILPILLGTSVVLQGSLNKESANLFGLSSAVFINACVFLLVSVLLLFAASFFPQSLPDFLAPKESLRGLKWQHLLPGLFGFFLVLGLPWSLKVNGPAKTFILIVSTQVIISLWLQMSQTGIPLKMTQILGAVFSILGAILILI